MGPSTEPGVLMWSLLAQQSLPLARPCVPDSRYLKFQKHIAFKKI